MREMSRDWSERSRVLIISEREPGKQSREVKEKEVDETPGNKKWFYDF